MPLITAFDPLRTSVKIESNALSIESVSMNVPATIATPSTIAIAVSDGAELPSEETLERDADHRQPMVLTLARAACVSRRVRLLLVPLDDLRVAHVSRIGIVARIAKRAPLPEEVPALVEADLDRFEPVVLVRV